MAATWSRRLRAFKRWMKSSGIEWNTDALEFTIQEEEDGEEEEMNISVRATGDLKEGQVIGRIPKSACLTVNTSSASQLIQEAGLGGSLGLAVALMYEKGLAHRSPWAPYLALLPDSNTALPLLWSPPQIDRLLKGTELHKTVKEDKGLIYEDWKHCILPLVPLLPPHIHPNSFGLPQYFAAKSLIASRSFQIDDYHGFGMVPLADLFNHKTGAEDVHFTSTTPDNLDLDHPQHSNSSIHSYDHDHENAADENGDLEPSTSSGEPSEAGDGDDDDPLVLEMIMVKDVRAGAEVFNTYGSVGNAALLHRYGFTEPDNPYDIVNIDLELVLLWSSSMYSARFGRARLSLWRKLGYSGCVSEDSEYFEIGYDGKPQLELLVLLYIILLTEETYHRLDLTVSSEGENNGKRSIGMILTENCNPVLDTNSEICRELLLTEGVCSALLWLADKRESLYGSDSIKDDTDALKRCSIRDRKLYHSLILRVSERKILEKLRMYATSGVRYSQAPKKASLTSRKRLKST